ncbi:DNA cytosine methyltransferase [Flagellimonas sp. 2504JD4-2]
MPKEDLNYIEIFAGVGGLGLGVSKAGFKQEVAIEKDKACYETFLFNKENNFKEFKNWDYLNEKVENVDLRPFENKVALLIAGPPCQPFSSGGKYLGENDSRNGFPEFVRSLYEVKPKSFLIENVRGLTSKRFQNYFEYLKLQLSYPGYTKDVNENWVNHFERLQKHHSSGIYNDLKYNLLVKTINASDYGIPQKRERVFIVGFRCDLGVEWSFPTETHSFYSLIKSKINGEYWDKHKVPNKEHIPKESLKALLNKFKKVNDLKPWVTLRDAIFDLPKPDSSNELSDIHNHVLKRGARSYKGHTGSPLDEPAKTLKAGSHGVPGGENMIRYYNHTVRYFTVRESSRLQTFPDNYIFNCSWGKSMQQLGNAVPIDLSYILATSIKSSLNKAPFNYD